ncbi:hypothetical protein VA596_16320 [Amycolatopsis sp., V23-08]|uniref:Uncharacterized protein n=1 Tax=Amycolatopsis heterodermiae TaxID=3110235 RepID=A0ABU5R4G8_9PSEU|nr:hypothetical protein [Amycolatopsis sp., V23-08]MEA5361111.1 hypothetical protein [Amycolatopsis sp., V23-08]
MTRRSSSWSASGTPTRSPITAMPSGYSTVPTNSAALPSAVASANRSSTRSTDRRTAGSSAWTRRTVKSRMSSRRSRVCSGGFFQGSSSASSTIAGLSRQPGRCSSRHCASRTRKFVPSASSGWQSANRLTTQLS